MGTLKISSSLTAALLLVPFLTIVASAQAPPERSGEAAGKSPPRIAVIDVQRVLDNYPKWKSLLAVFQSDKDAFEAKMRKELLRIEDWKHEKQAYKPGTPEELQIEEQIVRARVEVGVQVELKQREFALIEARIRYGCHEDIVTVVSDFALKYGFDVVLNKRGESVDDSDPAALQQATQRRVIWHRKDIDITNQVIEQLVNKQPTLRPNLNQPIPRPRN